MTRIPSDVRDTIEKAIYLPMTISILNKDLGNIQQGSFKLKDPYLRLIEQALKLAQRDLYNVKNDLRRRKVKVHEVSRDEAFTMYSFIYEGYEEKHNYFNPRIRNQVAALLEHYLFAAKA
ncbi:hypothetical protein VSK91_18190 [Bacillus swezeyi]|uniref:Uncharacterized protein n=1 Tax=Bacillus swezeyi TaxID=1925020 RepID=A0A5M8S1W2_9BACI|nr:hypothetical protein [Bacillus swezeyi]KAA6453416.1 hypothetical protein DX927_04255 [Bacillus swezeyi]KAA6475984.1 hypothetical protein DX928_07770 [Bacillus swezeyi]TYS38788.1 hypothetical protein FZC77_04135 [Bacillus swezeyi]